MSPLRLIGSGCRRALLAGSLALALPAVGWGAQGAAPTGSSAASCSPFCGVLRFMGPPSHAGVQHAHHATPERRLYATHRGPVRVAHAAPVWGHTPRAAYAAANRPPPGYPGPAYPRYAYWQPAYPGYGYPGYAYPGYGYVYYYVYPYGYRGY